MFMYVDDFLVFFLNNQATYDDIVSEIKIVFELYKNNNCNFLSMENDKLYISLIKFDFWYLFVKKWNILSHCWLNIILKM